MNLHRSPSLLLGRALIRTASVLLPRSARCDWLAEWESELWYLAQRPQTGSILPFCFGSFADALWHWRNETREPFHFPAPGHSIGILCAVASVALAITVCKHSSFPDGDFVATQLRVLVMTLPVLPSLATLSLGEYNPPRHTRQLMERWRRWVFLTGKFGLAFLIVFLGVFDLFSTLPPLQPITSLIAYMFACRWILQDQRQRCPVCLRKLSHPIRIGQASYSVLEWYGSEFICSQGHGVLHVRETATSSYSNQQWLHLDTSWEVLFRSPVDPQPTA